MGNPNDDSYKDLMDIIHKILGNQIPGKDGVPPIVGVKFVVGGGPQNAPSPSRMIPVEVPTPSSVSGMRATTPISVTEAASSRADSVNA